MSSSSQVKGSLFELLHGEIVNMLVLRHSSSITRHQGLLKVEKIGFDVGRRLMERCAQDGPCITTLLSAVKFLCKEFWQFIHKKNIDKLQTNNKGVFVLHDNNYQWLCSLGPSLSAGGKDEIDAQTSFSRGFLTGAFEALGWQCTVVLFTSNLPQCQIQCIFKDI